MITNSVHNYKYIIENDKTQMTTFVTLLPFLKPNLNYDCRTKKLGKRGNFPLKIQKSSLISEIFYPPKGTAKAVPERVHLTVFPF